MNDQFPPWLALPEEVRDRVTQRLEARFGPQDDSRTEEYLEDLRDLSAFRLINAYGLKKAMRKGRHYPAFGPNPKNWQAAYNRCEAIIQQQSSDPIFIERAIFLRTLVQEELARFYSHN